MNMGFNLVATINVERMMEMYPALWLFGPITGETLMRILSGALEQGVPEEALQELVDSDPFIVTVAGSVFSQLQNSTSFGYDGGRNDRHRPTRNR
jgi:hypothetical protein